MQTMINRQKILFLSLLLLFIVANTGCSTYTTNTDITFASTTLIGQEPEIYVGDITETADKLTFLGAVEAIVKKPNIFDEDPTPKQADIVLAHLGKEKGADAVIHVEYKYGIANGRITATGQAVKINTTNSYNTKKGEVEKTLEKFGLSADIPVQLNSPEKSEHVYELQRSIPHNLDDQARNEKMIALAKALAKAEAKAEAEAESARSADEYAKIDAMADVDNISHMISSVEYLIKTAKEHDDEDIYKLASILKRMLQEHLEKHERVVRDLQ